MDENVLPPSLQRGGGPPNYLIESRLLVSLINGVLYKRQYRLDINGTNGKPYQVPLLVLVREHENLRIQVCSNAFSHYEGNSAYPGTSIS